MWPEGAVCPHCAARREASKLRALHERFISKSESDAAGGLLCALLKRSNYGIHHHLGRKYLRSYCAERDFAYNNRKATDDQRVEQGTEGRWLERVDAEGARKQSRTAIESVITSGGEFLT